MSFILLFTCGVIAWCFSTIVAGGAATILMPIISLWLGANLTAPVISIAALLANPSRVYIFRNDIDWQVIRYMLPGSILGSICGAWSISQIDATVIQFIIGSFLILYVVQQFYFTERLNFRVVLPIFFPVGFIISYLSGLIGATGPAHNPFLVNYGLIKEKMIATKSLNSLIMQLTKLISYGSFGILTMQIGYYGLSLGLGAILGVIIAKSYLCRLDALQFKKYALFFMLISGISLILKTMV